MAYAKAPARAALAIRGLLALALIGVAMALVVPAPALAARAPFRFVGKTSQQLPVRFQIPYSFTGVRRFSIGWDAKCTTGAMLTSSTGHSSLWRFNRRGPGWNYPGAYRYTDVDPDYTASNGRRLSFRVVVADAGTTLINARVRGTWRTRTTVTDPITGQVLDTCTTGRVTWRADLV